MDSTQGAWVRHSSEVLELAQPAEVAHTAEHAPSELPGPKMPEERPNSWGNPSPHPQPELVCCRVAIFRLLNHNLKSASPPNQTRAGARHSPSSLGEHRAKYLGVGAPRLTWGVFRRLEISSESVRRHGNPTATVGRPDAAKVVALGTAGQTGGVRHRRQMVESAGGAGVLRAFSQGRKHPWDTREVLPQAR